MLALRHSIPFTKPIAIFQIKIHLTDTVNYLSFWVILQTFPQTSRLQMQ